MVATFHLEKIMTREQAEALIPGQKIRYWDDRIATVTQAATAPVPPPAPFAGLYPSDVPFVTIVFDADTIDPKPIYQIKVHDFMRAEPL
jgi:hypothetical protein